MHIFRRDFALAASLLIAGAGQAQAATLVTVDLTAQEGTSWSNIAATPVRLNFGDLGMGTVSVSSVNGGTFLNAETPIVNPLYAPVYNYTKVLGSGDTLNSLPGGTSVFTVSSPTAGSPSGFDMTFKLDNGNFAAGTAFMIGSLDYGWNQAFSPGAGFGAMDTVSLPSDGTSPIVASGPGGLGTLYKNSGAAAISDTRAFQLLGAQNSFTFEMLQAPNGRGGISFALALPEGGAVPEPATWLMMIGGIGMVGGAMRRRRSVQVKFA